MTGDELNEELFDAIGLVVGSRAIIAAMADFDGDAECAVRLLQVAEHKLRELVGAVPVGDRPEALNAQT